MAALLSYLPPEGLKILVVLFLSFLIGLEREEHKAGKPYAFGGVRTFPLLGLLGYALSVLSSGQLLPLAVGLGVVGGFMMLSFHHKVTETKSGGATTEVTGLLTYSLGALVGQGDFWIAATLVVLSLMLLELKTVLERLSRRIAPDEILTFTKFLLLTIVILPAVPDRPFTPFALNPFRTWVIVVAVSAVSYGSYVLQRLLRRRGGILLSAVLGGAYSSTLTTLSLARQSASGKNPPLYAGGILLASGMMYLRLTALVGLFNGPLLARLAGPFLTLAFSALAGGTLLAARGERVPPAAESGGDPRNPLELGTAFLFAGVFVVILVAARYAAANLGRSGVFTLAGIMGVADVDPFILGMTQSGSGAEGIPLAAGAILIAAASNNAAKGVYAFLLAERRAGLYSLAGLFLLALLGLLPLIWL